MAEYCFRNLVFEGGGVKGVAYVGALEVLKDKGILDDIQRIGGTSAGAITALMVGLNYSLEEICKTLIKLNFKNFMDDSWGILRDGKRVLNKFGFYKGNFFRQWVAEHVEKKTGNPEATFRDVHNMADDEGFKDLYFVATNLSTHFAEVFSYEHTPRMPIADAVRMSMSIPLFFAAQRNSRGDVYVDGGVLDNYPVKLFDREKYIEKHSRLPDYYVEHNKALKRAGLKNSPYVYNKETLGFRLDSAREIAIFRDQAEPPHRKIDDFFDYAVELVGTLMSVQDQMHLHSDDWARTVYVDSLGVGTVDFDLSTGRKHELIESGTQGAKHYFKWFDDRENDPAVNHPEDKRDTA